MFPDINLKTGPDEQWKVFDSRNGNDVGGYVRSLFEESAEMDGTLRTVYDKLPDQDIKYIYLYFVVISFTVPLSSQFQSAEEQELF